MQEISSLVWFNLLKFRIYSTKNAKEIQREGFFQTEYFSILFILNH